MIILAVLVLCFSNAALAEEISVQNEAYDLFQPAGQELQDSGASEEILTIPPLVADEMQPETPGSSTPEDGEPGAAEHVTEFLPDTDAAVTDAIPLLPEEEEPLPPETEAAEQPEKDPIYAEGETEQPTEEETPTTENVPEDPAETEPLPSESEPEEPAEDPPYPVEPEPETEEPEPEEPDVPAQEPDTTEHTDSHQVEERVHGSAEYRLAENIQMHDVFVAYDLFCLDCQRVIVENERIEQYSEPHGWTYVREEPTCSQDGVIHFSCAQCGIAYDETLPRLEHVWSEWEDLTDSDLPECVREEIKVRRCLNCGEEETAVLPPLGHQWEAVSYQEATCTQDGEAVRRCRLCGQEETIVLPAFGHSFVNTQDHQQNMVCAICGAVKEAPQGKSSKTHMYYNNTVTSFGPTTRELIGGSVWNRVTPVDLSKEGVFTYPLVAGNQYTVGTATLVNDQDGQQVIYRLSSSNINVHSESLVVYPNLEALKTGEHARIFDFNEPIDLRACFGDDAHVIIAITLKADYDADSTGVSRFLADQNWIDQMMEMIE